MKRYEAKDLRTLYEDAKTTNYSLHAEQRSNLQLVAGNHYTRNDSLFSRRVRGSDEISKTQRIRLTKNHINKITKIYRNEILTYSPGNTVAPKNKTERHDQKVADLHKSVLMDLKIRHKWAKLNRELVGDFVEIGEAFLKIYFDYNRGEFKGYDLHIDDDGKPKFDVDGNPVATNVFKGDMVFERILGFNVLTDPAANTWEECRYVIVTKMIPTKHLLEIYKGKEELCDKIKETTETTYKVFDTTNGGFYSSKGMTMVREYYFRPSNTDPNGYFYYAIDDEVMEEGELPMGIFPIIRVGFDELTTSPRAQSIIKQLRPYQAECNRCASKISETQITIGDDKIVITNGGRVSPGATAHGVKVIKCIGGDIKHLPGRSGDQYLAYMQQQISEMYQVANINEEREQKVSTNDPISQLFASVKDKKRFSIYSDKWGEFQKEWTMMSLRMTKEYYSEDMLIPIVGKREYVNIVEYKSMDDLSYEIVCEEQSEDVESKMGRHITLGNILQYVGNSLEPRDLGAIIRAMPYFNDEVILRDLTLDYDNVTNDILAMDRGEYIPAEPEENHAYIIKHLNRRMKEPEFKQLDMQIQQNYMRKKQEHVMLQQKIQEEIQRAQAGFIPTGGYLVDIGYYIADPSNPMASPRRAKVPAEAVTWLMKKLEEQGSDQDRLQQQQDMAVMQMQQQSMGLPAPQGNVGMVQ